VKKIGVFFLVTSVLLILHFLFTQNWKNQDYAGLRARKIYLFTAQYFEKKIQRCDFDVNYAQELNDKVRHYLEASYLNGTRVLLRSRKDIYHLLKTKKIVLIQENEYYRLDTMYYSYPFLTTKSKRLLDTIGEIFQRKLENTGLECTRFTVTSMLRTTNSIARLRKWNRNSIKNSPHLHGTSFDISYKTFFGSRELTNSECSYLGDALAKTIWELRRDKKCWATYETWQTCFHVVSR
jgi:hypothetical protein